MPIQTVQLRPVENDHISSLFNTGAQRFTGAIDSYAERIATRAKNKAINELLTTAPSRDAEGNAQSPLDYQQSNLTKLLGVQGMDYATASALASASAKPYFDEASTRYTHQQNAIKRMDELSKQDEVVRHNMATENQDNYTTFGNEYTGYYTLNKDTGKYEPINGSRYRGIKPSDVQMIPVTNTDAYGNTVTEIVPFNKRTMSPVGGSIPTGVKMAPITESEKKVIEGTATSKDLLERGNSLFNGSKKGDNKNIGVFDATIAEIGNRAGLNTQTGVTKSKMDSFNAEVQAYFDKAVQDGVMTNADADRFNKMIPSAYDAEDVARSKMKQLDNFIRTKESSAIQRMQQAHGGTVQAPTGGQLRPPPPLVRTAPSKSVPLEDLQPMGNGLYKMPDGTIIRKKAK